MASCSPPKMAIFNMLVSVFVEMIRPSIVALEEMLATERSLIDESVSTTSESTASEVEPCCEPDGQRQRN